jgi:hypothetical protein
MYNGSHSHNKFALANLSTIKCWQPYFGTESLEIHESLHVCSSVFILHTVSKLFRLHDVSRVTSFPSSYKDDSDCQLYHIFSNVKLPTTISRYSPMAGSVSVTEPAELITTELNSWCKQIRT